jgi:hypothetical protein
MPPELMQILNLKRQDDSTARTYFLPTTGDRHCCLGLTPGRCSPSFKSSSSRTGLGKLGSEGRSQRLRDDIGEHVDAGVHSCKSSDPAQATEARYELSRK